MTLRIILPDRLTKTSESYLIAALQNFGAEHIAANEWRYKQMALTCQEFVSQLKVFLPETERVLADWVKVTILNPSKR
jgi:phage FluMu gp28-like protein